MRLHSDLDRRRWEESVRMRAAQLAHLQQLAMPAKGRLLQVVPSRRDPDPEHMLQEGPKLLPEGVRLPDPLKRSSAIRHRAGAHSGGVPGAVRHQEGQEKMISL